MTAIHLQLSLRSSLMPPGSAHSDTKQACQARFLTLARPRITTQRQPRPGVEGYPGVKYMLSGLGVVDTHPQRRRASARISDASTTVQEMIPTKPPWRISASELTAHLPAMGRGGAAFRQAASSLQPHHPSVHIRLASMRAVLVVRIGSRRPSPLRLSATCPSDATSRTGAGPSYCEMGDA